MSTPFSLGQHISALARINECFATATMRVTAGLGCAGDASRRNVILGSVLKRRKSPFKVKSTLGNVPAPRTPPPQPIVTLFLFLSLVSVLT